MVVMVRTKNWGAEDSCLGKKRDGGRENALI